MAPQQQGQESKNRPVGDELPNGDLHRWWLKLRRKGRIFKGEVRNVATTPSNREFEQVPPGRFITLSVRAGEVFANQEKALTWLHTPNPSLNGHTPLEATATQEGFQEADEVLARIEYGVLG